MNYKTDGEGDEELLLSFGSRWDEKSTTSRRLSSPQRTERPLDLTISVDSPSAEKIPYGSSKGSNSVEIPNGDSTTPGTEEVECLNRDTLEGYLSSTARAINIKQACNETSLNNASSPDWVSFEESSNRANLRDPTNDIVMPVRIERSNGFDGDVSLKTNARTDNWVKFGMAKDDNSTVLHSPFTQPGEVIIVETPSQSSPPTTKEELLMLEDSLLGNDMYTNPFDNRELDRINPFPQTSPLTIHHSVSSADEPSDEPQADISSDKRLSVARNEDGILVSQSNESLPRIVEYPKKTTNKIWSVLLRYPDTKRKIRSRIWRPVVIKLDGSVLQVFEEHDKSAPFREVSLQCFYALTMPKLQQYHGGKVHTVKILYVKYKETQKWLNKKVNVQYVARATPILKIASTSHLVIQELTEVINDAIRSLPIFRDRGISHSTEAVYIDVQDTCSALLDSSGSILMLGILVRIYLKAFISGDAECQLVLNDCHLKSQEITRLRGEHMPQHVHKWINLENCDFHTTVNPVTYNQNHYILFKPLDSCTFEVMQFRVRQLKPLPLLARCDLIVDGHGRIEFKAELKLCSDPKLAKYERKNICLYFPIPETWVSLFLKEKLFHGEKSIRSTSTRKAIKMRNRFNRPACTIEVSTGSAKYEPEYKAIVWRINQLPLLNTTAPADAPHDFICHIQTRDLPENFKPHCVMEYEIPYTVASDTNIVNFKVSDKKIATQEVTYHAYYSYHIQMNARSLNGEAKDDS